MKALVFSVAVASMGVALFAANDADARAISRKGRGKATATQNMPSAAKPWGILATLAGTSWLQENTGTVTLYRWKLPNEILEIQFHSKEELEPRFDEIRLTADGSTLTRVTVQPKGQARRFAIEMPRPGILIEAEVLGATVTRRTSRVAGNSMFCESETTLNGAVVATDAIERRKASAPEITAALNVIAAEQGAKRLARVAMERKWGPLVHLVDNDWRYTSGGATFVTQYRWRDPGKVMVATHTALRKQQSYEETISLDTVTGMITGRANGLAVDYGLEDGAIVATSAGGKSRTLRKLTGATSYQLVTQKRKGADWVAVDNVLAENANGGIATTKIELASVREASAIAEPARIAVPLPPERSPAGRQRQSAASPTMVAANPQSALVAQSQVELAQLQALPPQAQSAPPKKGNGGLFGKLMGAAGGALAMGAGGDVGSMVQGAMQGAAMVDNNGNLAPGMAEAMLLGGGRSSGLLGGGGGNAAMGLLGTLGGGGRSIQPAQQAQAAQGTALRATSPSNTASGGSYPPRPNLLAGQPACRGYTVDNYKQFFQQNSNGPDVQLHTLCAGAYNYYWMYLNAIRQGYSQSDSDRTYAAFTKSASVATDFYAKAR